MTDNPFEGALDVLRSRGWTKHIRQDEYGAMCLLGGMEETLGMNSLTSWLGETVESRHPDYVRTLAEIIEESYEDRAWKQDTDAWTAASFNNHPDTTFADVERVLEKAAVKWEEERVLRND